MEPALVIKTVNQYCTHGQEILHMFEQFREMMNHCIQIGLAENVTSLKALSPKAYRQLAGYDTMSCYKLCAISATVGILRNYRKAVRRGEKPPTTPYVRRLRLTTCYGLKIRDGCLLLPHHPRTAIRIPLTPHVQATIRKHSVRSVTLTEGKLSLTYAKQVAEIKPDGFIGIDRNLNNVTLAATDDSIMKHDLSEATRVKATYREVRSHVQRNDVRLRREITSKYGRKQQEKVKQILHHASRLIVQQAKEQRFGIVMEQLTGIRRMYRRGNGQGPRYRGRMNSWSYAELQRQVEYKARWEGLPVIYVHPRGTSAKCSMCGSRMARIPEENRQLQCPSCRVNVDRDVNAARNILARGVRFAPIALPVEAMVQEPPSVGNPESRWKRVNLIGNPPTG
ncbi:MAG: transposase [Candidatus Bathyarchaeia archaeon]|jgi:putative transposase